MLKLFGQLYYIDFDVLDEFLEPEENKKVDDMITTKKVITKFDTHGSESKKIIKNEAFKPKEFNAVRFEIIRNFIEDLAIGAESNEEDIDEQLGSRNLKKMPARFKLAYNTLMYYNILRKLD